MNALLALAVSWLRIEHRPGQTTYAVLPPFWRTRAAANPLGAPIKALTRRRAEWWRVGSSSSGPLRAVAAVHLIKIESIRSAALLGSGDRCGPSRAASALSPQLPRSHRRGGSAPQNEIQHGHRIPPASAIIGHAARVISRR